MATKTERCSGCGLQLLIPSETSIFRFGVCQAFTKVRPSDPWGQAYDLIIQAPSRFNNVLQTVYSSINTMAAGSGNTYLMPGAYSYHYNYYSERPQPNLAPPSAHGRKRAVLCGVSYSQQRNKLKGSINDVKCIRYLFVEKFGFPGDSVLTLRGTFLFIKC